MKTYSRRCCALQVALVIACCTSLLGGCAELSDWRQETALTAVVHHAYRQRPSSYTGACARDFAAGWRQAYYNISKGSDACPPSVPPEEYWQVKYNNPAGRQRVATWFQGYRHGVAAAQRAGLDVYSTAPFCTNCMRESACECCPVHPLRKTGFYDRIEEFGSESALSGNFPVQCESQIPESAAAIRIDPSAISQTLTAHGPFELIEDEIPTDLAARLIDEINLTKIVDPDVEKFPPVLVEPLSLDL